MPTEATCCIASLSLLRQQEVPVQKQQKQCNPPQVSYVLRLQLATYLYAK